MTQQELANELDNIDIGYYESGAYYDTSREDWDERHIAELEEQHKLTVVEL